MSPGRSTKKFLFNFYSKIFFFLNPIHYEIQYMLFYSHTNTSYESARPSVHGYMERFSIEQYALSTLKYIACSELMPAYLMLMLIDVSHNISCAEAFKCSSTFVHCKSRE